MTHIKIYSTQTCPYCVMLKDYLKSKHIDFEEVMIDVNPAEGEKILDLCGSLGTPCTHIKLDNGKEVNILGFDKPKIDEVLGLA
jgi:glutaredoxin 3